MTRFLALAALLVAAPLQAGDAPVPGTPVGGVGVVSADKKAVFLPAKAGGIEAVDLASGKVLWTNKDASKLAGASDTLVLAWTTDPKKPTAFRLVAVDAATGKTAATSDPIQMPEWAVPVNRDGHTFRTAATAGPESATVVWQAGTHYAGGAAPSEEILAAAKRDATAAVRVDLKTGKVTATDQKPKDTDFRAGPGGGSQSKVGDYEFRVEEQIPGFKPGAAMVTKVTLTVLKGKDEVWKRELAGNPWSPPRP